MTGAVWHDGVRYQLAVDLDESVTTWVATYPESRGEIARFTTPLFASARVLFTAYLDQQKGDMAA